MRVCIDQAWNARVSGKIDHLSAARYRRIATCDASHAIVFDDDDRVGEHASCPIDQFAELDSLACRKGRRRCCEDQ